MLDTADIQSEREQIAREKEELLRKLQTTSLPQPVSTTGPLPQPVSSTRQSSNRNQEDETGRGSRGIQFRLEDNKKMIGGQWAVESSDSEKEEDKVEDGQQKTGSSALESVLTAVKNKKFGSSKNNPADVAKKILPGASSFEDIEKYVSAAKKEKMEKLRQKNKDYLKPDKRFWWSMGPFIWLWIFIWIDVSINVTKMFTHSVDLEFVCSGGQNFGPGTV